MRLRPKWLTLVSGLVLFISVAFFQLWHRADQSNLTRYPDEAAHFVTGVCTLDYLKTAFGSNPISFAEQYYARYPKVAFGHWPPMFYVIQAFWYAMFGATPFSAMLLMGLVVAIASLVLFLRLKRLNGLWPACLSIAVFLSLPVVRKSELMLMADMLASLFSLAAVLTFCDWWTTAKRRYWVMSGVWIALAALTKESALTLLVLAPVALMVWPPPIPFRQKLMKMAVSLPLLLSLILVLYAITGVLHLRGIPAPATLPNFWEYLAGLLLFFRGGSLLIFLIALYGALEVLLRKRFTASPDQIVHLRMALLWLTATLISQLLFREGLLEDRYFLSGYVSLVLLFGQGLACLEDQFRQRFARPVFAHTAAAALGILCIAFTLHTRIAPARTGYSEIAAAFPVPPIRPIILVSSDALGEGGMITEWLVRDKARAGVVLRASKVLASSDWMGGNQKLLVSSSDEVRELLDKTPVHFIVLDMYGFTDPGARPYDRLLEDTLRENPTHFRMIGRFPLFLDGQRRDEAVQVYENSVARGRYAQTIHIDMTNTLGRKLAVRLSSKNMLQRASTKPPAMLPKALLNLIPSTYAIPLSLGITPAMDTLSAEGGWGRIYVTAPPDCSWTVREVPDWIKLLDGSPGTGNGIVAYTVAENLLDKPRSATLQIGSQTFRIRQQRSFFVSVPFVDPFGETELEPDQSASSQTVSSLVSNHWVLENQPHVRANATITADGPQGRNTLVIQNPQPSEVPWNTLIYLPRINVKQDAKYTVSLRLKAEKPSLVWLAFGERKAPYSRCGLYQPLAVSTNWQEFVIPFQVQGAACGPNRNRLSIEAGEVAGKLWVSQFSIR